MGYLNTTASEQLAEAGIVRSFNAAAPELAAAARHAIEAIAKRQSHLTSEDVWTELEAMGFSDVGQQGSFLGGVLRKAASAGVIELAIGAVQPSARPSNHRRIMRVWKSRICAVPAHTCPTCGAERLAA